MNPVNYIEKKKNRQIKLEKTSSELVDPINYILILFSEFKFNINVEKSIIYNSSLMILIIKILKLM